MGRSCEKDVLKRGPWTEEEDQKLIAYIQQHSYGSGWTALAKKAGLNRCGKSCRLRWINYLRPGIKRGKFSLQEEQTIIQLHAFLGNRWSAIAAYLPKRTDNEIKNHWNTHLKKRLIKMGVDPMTHKPARIDVNGSSSSTHGSNDANLICHMAQWERARLEAEARAARGSNIAKQTLFPNHVQPKSQLRSRTPAVPLPLASKPKCLDILQAWQGIVSDVINFPSHHYLESSSSMSSQSQVPTAGINQNAAAATNLYTCDELDGLDSWDRVDKFNHQMQELENVMDESTPILAMEGTSTYSTEDGWFMDNTFQQGNDDGDDLVANFMEDSWETLIGIPVSFSPMEVEISNGMGL